MILAEGIRIDANGTKKEKNQILKKAWNPRSNTKTYSKRESNI